VTPTEASALPMGSMKRVTRGRTRVSITTQQSSRPGPGACRPFPGQR
jgi:hypothetical protein